LRGERKAQYQEGAVLPKLISAEEDPVTRRKEAVWIPLATERGGRELCIRLQIQERDYEFIIDTGADLCLVQPYVGDEPTDEIRDAVRGITGQELEIEGSRRLDFLIGNRWYGHDFVVAPFPIQKDGIIGPDLLRALGAPIDLTAEEMEVGGQKIKLKNHPSIGRKVYGRHSRASRTEPRAQKSTEDGVMITLRTATESRRPEVETEKEVPAEQSGTEPPTEGGQKNGLHKWQAVLPQAVHLEPRTILITRAKITDQQRRAAPKSSIEGWAHAEPSEMPIKGVYAARTVSRIFASSELVDVKKRTTRQQSKQLADDSNVGQGPNEAVYCTS
jgi:hypothetical protein